MEASTIETTSSAIKSMEMNPGSKRMYFVTVKRNSKIKLNQDKPIASLNTKTGVLWLGVAAVRTLGIANQFYKIVCDEQNKAIGFKMLSTLPNSEQRNGWRVARVNKRSGMLPMSVKPAVNMLKNLKPAYRKLPIKRYHDYTSKLDNETYYYVELK